ncbi:MAG: molybdenum cofactor biosynthesis protein MoeB, partial [Bacteroidetes bacterium]|nr:molybdenum cofactor biosynthesis protein MoeB [Bacteroidota bacterium]
MSSFSKEELVRYSRQMMLPEIKLKGQEKIKAAKVLVVGAGG